MREVLREVNDELDSLYKRVEELEEDLEDPKHLLNLLAELKEGD